MSLAGLRLDSYFAILSSVITLFLAGTVLRHYALRHSEHSTKGPGLHLLVWGIGLAMYGIAVLCEALNAAVGWNPLLFRLWYLFGAVLVAAWLGQGTVYLLAQRRMAHALLLLLLAGSLFGAVRVFSATLDPSLMPSGELSGRAIITPGVRILTPFFNIYGLIALAGGAVYSAWKYWRRGAMRERVIGNLLITLGALAPSLGGLFSRLGAAGYLYLGELLGAVFLYMGFVLSSARSAERSEGQGRPHAVRGTAAMAEDPVMVAPAGNAKA
jgi:hypothetical protein